MEKEKVWQVFTKTQKELKLTLTLTLNAVSYEEFIIKIIDDIIKKIEEKTKKILEKNLGQVLKMIDNSENPEQVALLFAIELTQQYLSESREEVEKNLSENDKQLIINFFKDEKKEPEINDRLIDNKDNLDNS